VYKRLPAASKAKLRKFTPGDCRIRENGTAPLAVLMLSKLTTLVWVATNKRSLAASRAMLGMLDTDGAPPGVPSPVAEPATVRSIEKVELRAGAALTIDAIA
jgi:hypothetical protein